MFAPHSDPVKSGVTIFNLRAGPLFERARFYAYLYQSASRLLRRSWCLPLLADYTGLECTLAQPTPQTQAVLLAQIKGSVNRCDDFDRHFYPLSDRLMTRWTRIASMMLQDAPLPPVELAQVGAIYFVVDGHHRVSVARMLRYATVDAVVSAVYEPCR